MTAPIEVPADLADRVRTLCLALPFFAPRAGRDRIGVLVTGETDWTEIRELVTESYRILPPAKLTALLDEPPRAGEHPD